MTSIRTRASGQLLGQRYRLAHLIASGGMAEVWEATDEILGRRVAVKMLHSHLAADPAFIARFRAEALASARVRHPSIVAVYDTLDDDGEHAIVMELLDGQTLRQVLDAHPNPPLTAMVRVIAEVALALDEAHRCGVVHRDVKPANIILCDDDRVKITDFGIAKATESLDLTEAGQLVGTMKYMAPEQVDGSPLDGRADLYSLGIVLYEAVCGRLPFSGDTDLAIATARLERAPIPPRQIRPGLPRDLESIVLHALARRPDERQASCADLAASLRALRLDDPAPTDLTDVLDPSDAPEAPTSFAASERRWLVPALLVVLVGVALTLAGVLIGQSDTGQKLFDRVSDAVGRGEASTAPTPPPVVVADTEVGDTDDDDPPAGELTTSAPIAVRTFDPQGTGPPGEHDELVAFAHDGDLATEWHSERYNDVDFGLKDGIGLIVDLAEGPAPSELVVRTANESWSGAVYAGDGTAEDLAGWGAPVVIGDDLPAAAVFELPDIDDMAVVLVWFRHLGANPDGRMQVHEIELR